MKRIITFGVFDYFHYGHLKLLEQAKSLSRNSYLIVAVQESDFIKKTKPNCTIMYTTEQRKELVSALRYVDEVISYTDVDKTIQTLDFDILALGQDQNHTGFQNAIKYCLTKGKECKRLKRTPNICSSQIKKKIP